jgi:hypothetical protein
MKYIENEYTKLIRKEFSIDDMLQLLLDHGLINEISEDYGSDIYSMCNNATLILGKFIYEQFPFDDVKICEGVFNMEGNHTWIELDNMICDVTVAQFISNAPKLAFLDKVESVEYQSVRKYNFREWVSQLN